MKKIIALFCLFAIVVQAQDKKPYQFFDKKGKKTNYGKLLKVAEKNDVVLFGEYHNNSIVHWLQLEFTKDMAEQKQLVLGAEMIEADNQEQLDQYLKGEINQKAFDTLARLWSNHKTDYKPLIDFAKDNNIKFVAANIPRRYANQVYKQGIESLEALTDEEKSWIVPLPMAYDKTLPGYAGMLKMMGDHANPNMPKAQAIKDATMAHFIIKNLEPHSLFIHYNGTYHSDNYEGISWYLKREMPELKILTIATVEQADISRLEKEHLNKADFILVVDEDVTKTY